MQRPHDLGRAIRIDDQNAVRARTRDLSLFVVLFDSITVKIRIFFNPNVDNGQKSQKGRWRGLVLKLKFCLRLPNQSEEWSYRFSVGTG